MIQTPSTGSFLHKWRGDTLKVELRLEHPRVGIAVLRTNLGRADVYRREIVAKTEEGVVPQGRAWTDLPLDEVEPGVFRTEIALNQVGIFSAKACFFPKGSRIPEWPEGGNFRIKVESAETRSRNSIYCVFPRQFGSFREIIRRLPHIMDTMGFRIVQTLPPFPVPTTYAVMGEYGCPFAATDFYSVDPAMAEFDKSATPMMQFKELIEAVHAKHGLMLVDLPANHTGWASALQTHHPEWFRHEADGQFHSPGAWGVTWGDLVELDYANAGLRKYMADVFLFWCRNGVDGFRCDAGYMIPSETWEYIVAKVRDEYPDTIFFLEGLGGELSVTDRLLAESNLDWAYSELFQTYDRDQFERYLPAAIARSEKYGTLVHFAETHDNDRLAKNGATYARLRVQLAALLSWQGAWGIANGVEWYATEKIDVHGKNDLNWGASPNMVMLIANLNRTLAEDPTFTGECHLEVVTRGGGNTLVVRRRAPNGFSSLVIANLDCANSVVAEWDTGKEHLEPGEVKYVVEHIAVQTVETDAVRNSIRPLFHVKLPRDVKREVVVPEFQWVEISADCDFRMRLVDPKRNKTIRVYRSHDRKVMFDAPHYYGDGTKCRRLYLDAIRYVNSTAHSTRSLFLVPPNAESAQMVTSLSGDEVREHPEYRTVLSNGAGAAAQVRLGWSEIYSQYDAFLAANPNPDCPSDRTVLWTRTRAWLQCDGYLQEINRKSVIYFTADPAGRSAEWNFLVPCGMGREVVLTFTLSLVEGRNAAVLKVERVAGSESEVEGHVRLVFRPDVENRSFHANTKAYRVEDNFFTPIEFQLENCEMHEEGQWTYNVPHPEEEVRGQEPAGDVFSPGWISADLDVGDTATIMGEWK